MSPQAARVDLPALLREVPGDKAFGVPLARYTSWRIGGPAEALVAVENLAALCRLQAVARRHGLPLFVLGGGSNLLVRDGGIRGIVVLLRGAFRRYRLMAEDTTALVEVGAGYPLSRLALQLGQQGWSGLEFAYGIPGTVGGAMVMNAGTSLGELGQVLVAARLLLADGRVSELPVAALGLGYRTSSYPSQAILLAARLRLHRGERAAIEAVMRQAYRQRQRTQPLWLPNAGSVFKNPPGVAAGRLIEAAGLKGTRIGGAMVSPRHANFIVNVGGARAADVEALIALIRQRVWQAFGVLLELEVRIVGEPACSE
ncbi:MAG: UDP-N-acetylenolpyruvoylglucosamine reductase [Candidatus Tectimicrobiota bacterium]|nr:MAG: UDP-N-acetylenolpyruvoylglucosamine reductase [Candidatus Tectomicrobia bacterium]